MTCESPMMARSSSDPVTGCLPGCSLKPGHRGGCIYPPGTTTVTKTNGHSNGKSNGRSRLEVHAQCPECTPGRRCDKHKEHAHARPKEVRAVLRQTMLEIEAAIETHKWKRNMSDGRNADPTLHCIACGATIEWDARGGGDLVMPASLLPCPKRRSP